MCEIGFSLLSSADLKISQFVCKCVLVHSCLHVCVQEEAQRDKTSTVKGTSSPEFKEQFKLNINRNHRGFRRVVQSKGVKFEIVHKG